MSDTSFLTDELKDTLQYAIFPDNPLKWVIILLSMMWAFYKYEEEFGKVSKKVGQTENIGKTEDEKPDILKDWDIKLNKFIQVMLIPYVIIMATDIIIKIILFIFSRRKAILYEIFYRVLAEISGEFTNAEKILQKEVPKFEKNVEMANLAMKSVAPS